MTFDLTLLSIIAPALMATLLVAATHVPLGLEVLKRGIIFIDLAVAQIAGLGAVAASIYIGEAHGFQDMLIINAFAFGAALSNSPRRRSKRTLRMPARLMVAVFAPTRLA